MFDVEWTRINNYAIWTHSLFQNWYIPVTGIMDNTTIHNLLPYRFWNNLVDLVITSLYNAEFKCFWNEYKNAYRYLSVVIDACKPWDRYKNQSNFCVPLGNLCSWWTLKANSATLIRLVAISSSCGGKNCTASIASANRVNVVHVFVPSKNVKNTLKIMANLHMGIIQHK